MFQRTITRRISYILSYLLDNNILACLDDNPDIVDKYDYDLCMNAYLMMSTNIIKNTLYKITETKEILFHAMCSLDVDFTKELIKKII